MWIVDAYLKVGAWGKGQLTLLGGREGARGHCRMRGQQSKELEDGEHHGWGPPSPSTPNSRGRMQSVPTPFRFPLSHAMCPVPNAYQNLAALGHWGLCAGARRPSNIILASCYGTSWWGSHSIPQAFTVLCIPYICRTPPATGGCHTGQHCM
jgi:hypothetical protein